MRVHLILRHIGLKTSNLDFKPRYGYPGLKFIGFPLLSMLVKGRSRMSAEGPSLLHREPWSTTMETVVLQLIFAEYLMTNKGRVRADVARPGLFEPRCIVHATLTDLSWLRDRRGNA